MFSDIHLADMLSTLIYCVFGLVIFMVTYFVIEKIIPYPVRKEIEEDQNVALAILIGAFILGLAIIIAAVILSPGAVPPPAEVMAG